MRKKSEKPEDAKYKTQANTVTKPIITQSRKQQEHKSTVTK